jgi:hypothetical protein
MGDGRGVYRILVGNPEGKRPLGRLIVIIIEVSPSYQLPTKFYPKFFWPG